MSQTQTRPASRSISDLKNLAAAPAVVAPSGAAFDPDAWHAMDQRDNALVTDEITRGGSSDKFTYSFNMRGADGGRVTGVSVIGARHLAAHYGGLNHRLIMSVQKTGPVYMITTYPHEGVPAHFAAQHIETLADDPDFYKIVIEVHDVKKGLKQQHETTEPYWELRKGKDGSGGESDWRLRPHVEKIAQAKGLRNGILSIVPQDIVQEFKRLSLEAGQNQDMTADVIGEKRDHVLRFASAKGIAVNRRALEGLTLVQISGLGDAARESIAAFTRSLAVHGCTGFIPATRDMGEIQGVTADGAAAGTDAATDGATSTATTDEKPAEDAQPAATTTRATEAKLETKPAATDEDALTQDLARQEAESARAMAFTRQIAEEAEGKAAAATTTPKPAEPAKSAAPKADDVPAEHIKVSRRLEDSMPAAKPAEVKPPRANDGPEEPPGLWDHDGPQTRPPAATTTRTAPPLPVRLGPPTGSLAYRASRSMPAR